MPGTFYPSYPPPTLPAIDVLGFGDSFGDEFGGLAGVATAMRAVDHSGPAWMALDSVQPVARPAVDDSGADL